MPITIYDVETASWQETDQVHVYRAGMWTQVAAAYVWTSKADGTPRWVELFHNHQDAPTTLRGSSPTHNSVTLTWNPAPQATHYKLVMTIDGHTGTQSMPPGDQWGTALSHTWTGLSPDNVYRFVALARRTESSGTTVTSGPSNMVTLSTGHPDSWIQNSAYPGTQVVTVDANKTDTWDSNKQWASWPGEVVQGYESQPAKRGRGCVSYSTVHSQLNSKIGSTAADNVEVVSVLIDRIWRFKGGGSGRPRVDVYPCKVNFNSNAKPVGAGSGSSFTAPYEGTGKSDFTLENASRFLGWVKKWARGDYAEHNGLLIYRADDGHGAPDAGYGGHVVFRGTKADFPSEWRLRMNVRWRYLSGSYQPPTLS